MPYDPKYDHNLNGSIFHKNLCIYPIEWADQLLNDLIFMTTTRLNLGCGPSIVPGWLNCDYSLGLLLAKAGISFLTKNTWDRRIRVVNLARRLPFKDGSISCVYLCHVLEHMHRGDGEALCREVYRVLCVGGIFRLVVPGIGAVISGYNNGTLSADCLLETWLVVPAQRDSLMRNFYNAISNQNHVCMYDNASCLSLLNRIGFNVMIRAPFDSAIADIRDIERPERVEDASIVICEGTKPSRETPIKY